MEYVMTVYRILRSAICMTALLLILFTPPTMSQTSMETGFLDRTVKLEGTSFHYQVYVPFSYADSSRWPVILFLHGSGERGNDGLVQTQVGIATQLRTHPERYPAIVVMPQAPPDSYWTGLPARMAMAALDKTLKEFKTDPARVYLTGLSMGGNGSWYLAYRNPSRFAAVVPVCGWVKPFDDWSEKAETVVPPEDGPAFEALARKLAKVPIWILHGEEDNAVPVNESRQAFTALTAAGALVQFSEFMGTGHNVWDAAYGSSKFVEWLFKQKR
jgi:predicted peptidase